MTTTTSLSRSDERDIRTRRKCIEVTIKAILGPGETIKLNLLRSITNVIHQSPTVLTGSGTYCEVPPLTEDNQHLHIVPLGVDPAEDPLVFSCWLLAVLSSLHGSEQLRHENVELQIKVLQGIVVRSPYFFRIIMDDFHTLGYDAVIVNNQPATHILRAKKKQLLNQEEVRLMAEQMRLERIEAPQMNDEKRTKLAKEFKLAKKKGTDPPITTPWEYRPLDAVLSRLHKQISQPVLDITCPLVRQSTLLTVLQVLTRVVQYMPLFCSRSSLNHLVRLASMASLGYPSHLSVRLQALVLLTELLGNAGLPQNGSVQRMVVQAVLVGIRDIANGTLQRRCQPANGGDAGRPVDPGAPGSSTALPGNVAPSVVTTVDGLSLVSALERQVCCVAGRIFSLLGSLRPACSLGLYQQLTGDVMEDTRAMHALPSQLRETCVNLYVSLHHQHEAGLLAPLLSVMVSNFLLPQVISGIVPRLMLMELERALPRYQARLPDTLGAARTTATSAGSVRKRRYSESNADGGTPSRHLMSADRCSRVWRLAVSQLQVVLERWRTLEQSVDAAGSSTTTTNNKYSNWKDDPLSQSVPFKSSTMHKQDCLAVVRACLIVAAEVAVSVPAVYKHRVRFLPESVVRQLTELLQERLFAEQDPSMVHKLMQLLNLVVWFVNVIEGGASSIALPSEDPPTTPGSTHPPKRPHLAIPSSSTSASPPSDLNHVWIALASLPWLDKENDCLDLKVPDFKKFINMSNKIKWAKVWSVQQACVGVLGAAAGGAAPEWRCRVVRDILAGDEGGGDAARVVARHLPLLVHNIGPTLARPLCEAILPLLARHQKPTVAAAAARAFRHTACGLLGLLDIRFSSGVVPASPEVVQCRECDLRHGDLLTQARDLQQQSDTAKHNSRLLAESLRKRPRATYKSSETLASSEYESRASAVPNVYALMVPTSCTKFKLESQFLVPFYDLLSSDDPDVLLGLVHALPAFVHHGCFSSLLMLHYTSLVFHENLLVQSTAAGVFPLLGLVRMADDESAGSDHSTLRFMLQHLLKITRDPSLVAQKCVQTGIILFIKQIVQLSSPGSCVFVLVALMHCLCLTEHRNVVAEVHLAVAALALRCGLTPGQLVHQNRQIVCKVLVERAREDSLEMILCHAAEVFRDSEFTDVRRLFDSSLLDQLEFTSSYFRHLLCPLVVRAAKEECRELVMALLGCIAKGEELNNQVAAAVGGCEGPSDSFVPAASGSGGGCKKQPISLLIDHFQHIVAHAAFLYPVDVVEKCIQFVADSTGSHPITIHLCSMQNQVNELVLGLGEFRERALQELECLTVLENISADKETPARLHQLLAQHKQIRRRPASVPAVRGFLTKRFLGVLVFLDSKLVSVNSMPHERELAVLGLAEVVSVVGRDGVTGMARKLLATLKLALDHTPPSFWKQCALAWRQYIFYLQPDQVSSLVEEILVSVSPLLAIYPLTLGPTVNRLLSKFPELSRVVSHLPPLPVIPQLKRLNTAIEEYRQLGKKGYTEQQLLTVVSSCTAGLRHDSCDVRKHGLYRLLHVLRTRHAQLCALALNRDSPHAALSELCIALIAQCRTPHEDLQVLVAEALGLLGAIDPARLIRVEQLQQDQSRRVHASLTSPGFIRDLVTELARAFLAATDSSIQNCASFAMQELLRIHDIRAAPSSTPTNSRAGIGGAASTKSLGVQVWEQLPQHVQELLRPLYTSKYIMSGGTGEANSFRRRPKVAADATWNPIYGTKEGMSFKLWLTAWLSQLLSLVEDDKDHEVFSACRPIFRRDTNTGLHILPPIIMSVLLHSPQHHAKVASEVLAVMAGVQHSEHEHKPSPEPLHRSCEELHQKGLGHTPTKKGHGDGQVLQNKMEPPPLTARKPDRQLQQLCVETVFSVLDALNVWVQQRWTEESGNKKHRTAFIPSPELQQMIDFLAVLPSEQLARTAFKCQAYTRALRHIEDHIRSRPDSLGSHLTFMQHVFNALDEPDGVKGIASIRCTEPSVHDHILLYKANGRVHDALGCYEYLCSQKKSREPVPSCGSSVGCVPSTGPTRQFRSTRPSPTAEAGGVMEADVCDGLLLEDDPHVGLLQCYISLDQPQSVLDITHALINKNPQEEARLSEFRMEAAWRLFRWDDLELMLSSCQGRQSASAAPRSSNGPPPSKLCLSGVAGSWGEGVAEVLVSVRRGRVADYLKGLERLRKQIIPLISAATMEKGAYQRAYPYLLKLHILSELEDTMSGFLQLGSAAREGGNAGRPAPGREELRPLALTVEQLVQKWDDRLDLIQTSYKNLEPVLSFRRTLLMLAREVFSGPDEVKVQLQAEVERFWLQTAKVARKASMLQQGETAFLQAGVGRDVFVERAKWMQAKGDVIAGLDVLRRGITKHFPHAMDYKGDSSAETRPERMACSRAQLLLAKCSEEAAILDVNSLMLRYRDSSEIDRDSEDGHFHFAMYLDRILACRREKSVEYQYHIVASLNKALSSGNKHLYESLPRMLTIWLELGTLVAREEAGAKKAPSVQLNAFREKLSQMNALIGGTVDSLSLYQLMTALPQFISRICHSHPGVFKQISVIIATLMAAYPQQAIWHMVAVSKSSFNVRVQRCLETFEAAKRKRPGLAKLVSDVTKLADRFIELSNKQVEKGTTIVSVSALVRSLPRLLSESDFSSVLIPTQHQMTVRLPPTQHRTFARAPSHCAGLDELHKPFPSNEVYIIGIEDQAEVMASLQQPKKIVLKGSDGNSYILMCKPKDDLRKDGRLMDFTRFVNRLLVRDPDSRGRDLTIRTYGVVPLNEECGLMEWVHNLNGLRNVLHKIYREKGMYMPATELKLYMCKQEVPLDTKLDIFLNKLKARHPPVLAEWFLRTFPHPHTWYHGRRAYCHTAGVMSMVGYVLGLGDRHGENLNLDSMTGDLVHVDFNCLFNKGESFDWPERVPFRLTHNMVEAMGHGAMDGLFRAACLITMRIMRQEREALMSVLKPFIHDPLVEWSKGDKLAKNTGEICNEKAQLHVRDIELRLKGVIASKARGFNIPLSVEGQVDLLISDATSDKNLCQMYIGWAPYL